MMKFNVKFKTIKECQLYLIHKHAVHWHEAVRHCSQPSHSDAGNVDITCSAKLITKLTVTAHQYANDCLHFPFFVGERQPLHAFMPVRVDHTQTAAAVIYQSSQPL